MKESVFKPDIDFTKRSAVPPAGRTVLVQCKGFRCLAYRDSAGKWRDANRRQELPEVIRVLWDVMH